jgi:Fe-S-cluster-containing hydrogenase component 2
MECPVDAITMKAEGAWIDPEECIGCGKCYDSCAFEAIEEIQVDESASARA